VNRGANIRYLLHGRSIAMEHVRTSPAWYMRLVCSSASLQACILQLTMA
jgi:hypothetical protein